MLLVVDEIKGSVENVQSASFQQLKIWERNDLQEWIRKNTEILGEDLLIVSMEFNQFVESKDRLDLLAVDKNGNLVVIELKRDAYAGYADLQSVRYAAMVSTMTLEKLSKYYNHYRIKYLKEENIEEDSSLQLIQDFVENDDFVDLTNSPRIILCSENFSQEITTTVLWLNDNGLDISCVRIVPHKVGNNIVMVPTKIIPLQEASNYMVSIKEKRDEVRSNSLRKKKRKPTMSILLNNDIIKEGDIIYLDQNLPDYVEFKNENIFKAEITGKLNRSKSVKWLYNNELYSLSKLTATIFNSLKPDDKNIGAIHGSLFWSKKDELESLWNLAIKIQEE